MTLQPVDRTPLADETDLIARIRAGDEGACERLVREHGGPLSAVARRYLGNEDDAADTVQDAFLAAFRAINNFAGNCRIGTWLHRIAVNICLMKLRSRRRRPTVSIEDLLPTFDETGHHKQPVRNWTQPVDQLEQAETHERVRASIELLPEPYRTVLIMRDIEGHDTEQTAKLLDIHVGAVKTRLHRARQALRELLVRQFQSRATSRTNVEDRNR